MQPSDYDVETLNDLIATTIDSVDGYRAAAQDAASSRVETLFYQRATEREEVTDRLQDYVRELGGIPVADGSAAGGAHRLFAGLRETVANADDDTVMTEVERGEDHLKAKYERALSDADLAPRTREVIGEAFETVKHSNDEARDMKLAA